LAKKILENNQYLEMNLITQKIYKFIVNQKTESILFLLLVFSLLWLKEINFLFYDTLKSPDFDKYFVYVDYFFTGEQTSKEHGLMYYYLHSVNYSFFYGDFQNFEFFLDKSIQQVNFYIFIFGLIGYYLLLDFLGYSKRTIFLTFIFINFFPPAIAMRLVLKPEILAFAVIPWIIYLLEKFIKKRDFLDLIISIPFIISAITLKGNVLVVVCIYLIVTYFSIFLKLSSKQILFLVVISTFSFLAISIENNMANGKTILDIQSGSEIEDNYDFKAPMNVLYKVDLFTLFTSPVKPAHAESFIGITLLETTGDYFDLYWNNDDSIYSMNRKVPFKTVQSNEIKIPKFDGDNFLLEIYKQNNTDRYPRKSLGIVISSILYFLLIKNIFTEDKYRKYLLMGFYGMGIILFHSITGIPKNNFDPLVGDTFKPQYYSFAIIFSFIFLVASLLKESARKIFPIVIYSLLIIFILGFPKYYDYDLQINLVPKIENSLFCEIEKSLFLSNSEFQDIRCEKNMAIGEYEKISKYNKIFNHQIINLAFILSTMLSSIFIFINRRV
jgi:hypothetical protein